MEQLPEGLVIRPAEAGDVPSIHRVMASAFRLEEGSEKWLRARQTARDWGSFLVLQREGDLVGAARIGRERLRLGRETVLLKGDVGHVSILRELQGGGLGTLLMREVVHHLDAGGFHISRLGGLNAFYARFGYVPFPRRYFEFPLEPVGAGAATLTPDAFLAPSGDADERVRPYTADSDWAGRCRLYDLFHAGHTGAFLEERGGPPPSGGPDASGFRWVHEEDGSVRAYAFAGLSGTGVELHDAAGDPGYPHAFAAVVRRVLWEAARRGATQGLGRLPHDAWVESTLVEGRVPYVLREMQTAPASNMILLVRLARFLDAAMPEWTRRLREGGLAPWTGPLELRVGDEAATLVVAADSVRRASVARPAASLRFPVRAFLLAALGHRDWHEVAPQVDGAVPPALGRALGSFLRRDTVASGPLG